MQVDLEITHTDVVRGTRLVVVLSDGRVLVLSLDELLAMDAALLNKGETSERKGRDPVS